jgi:hypothetical protein
MMLVGGGKSGRLRNKYQNPSWNPTQELLGQDKVGLSCRYAWPKDKLGSTYYYESIIGLV